MRADALLGEYLAEQDPRMERRLLDTIAAEVRTVVSRVIGSRLGRAPHERERLEDACQDCMVSILDKIRRLKEDDCEPRVASISAYAAVAAQNAYRGDLRTRYPERQRASDQIVELVRKHPGEVACWRRDGKRLCGLSEWNGSAVTVSSRYEDWRTGAERPPIHLGPDSSNDPIKALVQFFRWLGSPVPLSELTAAIASRERTTLSTAGAWRDGGREVADPIDRIAESSDVEERVVEKLGRQHLLRQAWEEISLLPLGQRRALLLALPPEGFMAYRLLVGRDSLCKCLEYSPEQMDGLFERLPVSDNDVAATLGIKRQQVINLRQAARQRLARRFKGDD